jgi:hypothetical protein
MKYRFLSFLLLSLTLVMGLSLWIVPTSEATAATYYVGGNGSDGNSGTAGQELGPDEEVNVERWVEDSWMG